MRFHCTNIALFLFLCIFFCTSGFAQGGIQEDPLLTILQNQLEQQYNAFPKRSNNPVYFLTYRVEETEDHQMASSMGSPTQRENYKQRILTVQIRVGNPKLDNFHVLRDDVSDFFSQSRKVFLPIDNNEQAINQIIARETRQVYIEAINRYNKVLTNVAVKVLAQDTTDDYTLLPFTKYYEPPMVVSDLNYEDWQQKINRCTSVFCEGEHVIDGSANIHYYITRKYLVNSEGTSIVENHTYAYLYLSATAQAEDGMNLPLMKSYFAQNPNDFPTTEQLINDAVEMKDKLRDLWEAPVADTYVGPVVFSNEAAGVFFHEVLGHQIEGSSFKNEDDGQMLKNKIGEHILPDDFTVTFDPTSNFINDAPLSGSYVYDDEGVKGQKVVAVDHGILKNFLMTRTPIEGIAQTNGHARAEATFQPVSRQSNLIVTVGHSHSETELRQMLRQEAKTQGKSYGYWIQSVQNGYAMTGRSYPNAFNICPLEVYRVYVDGRPDELVRGVNLVGTPLSVLAQVTAGGDLTACFSGICGAASGNVPTHCCSPAILIRQIETQRQAKNQNRPPILDRPYADTISTTGSFEEAAFRAMKDEMMNDMNHLKLDDMLSPLAIDYRITDAHIYSVSSILGSVITMQELPYRDFESNVFVGNGNKNNENFVDENGLLGSNSTKISLPLDNNYNNIRRSLWKNTDELYKKAAAQYAGKQDAIKQQNLPMEMVNLDDRSDIISKPYINDKYYEKITLSQLQNIACELSAMFEKTDSLVNSGVNVYAYQANVYFMGSDNVQYAQPFSLFCVHIYAEATALDGQPLMDCTNLFYRDLKDLPAMEVLRGKVQTMMDNLLALRHAPKVTESYGGPVLFAGEAAAQIFGYAFLNNSPNIIASRQPIVSNQDFLRWYASYLPKDNVLESWIDKRVINSALSIRTLDGTAQFGDLPLIGYYQVDADGLKVDDSHDIIKNGILLTLLSDRTPTLHIPYSNGHARLALNANTVTSTIGAGVLALYGQNKFTEEKLKKKLITQAKSDGYKYAYIIRKMADRNMTDITNSKAYFTSTKTYLPIYLYRIDVSTGNETLVRMAQTENITIKTFKQLSLTSKTMQAYNTLSEGNYFFRGTEVLPISGVPCSLIVPNELLFNELDIIPAKDIPFEPIIEP